MLQLPVDLGDRRSAIARASIARPRPDNGLVPRLCFDRKPTHGSRDYNDMRYVNMLWAAQMRYAIRYGLWAARMQYAICEYAMVRANAICECAMGRANAICNTRIG